MAVLFAAAALLASGLFAPAAADEGVGDCFGIDFDPQHPVAIGKVAAGKPRAYFAKNATDSASCPAAGAACQEKAYLIPGNLALLGKAFGTYTCVSYESAQAPKPRWTDGWIASASLAPATPAPAISSSDWIGNWTHAGGEITITGGADGGVTIRGEAFYQAAQNVHTGVIDATAEPANGLIEFADDGSVPFDKAIASATCLVRMRRIELLLVVEDNGGCGGADVTFTGFYRKNNESLRRPEARLMRPCRLAWPRTSFQKTRTAAPACSCRPHKSPIARIAAGALCF